MGAIAHGSGRWGGLLVALLATSSVVTAQVGRQLHLPAQECRVVGVRDGDTLRVLCNRHEVTVRLWGIDCPERGMAFAQRARQWTSRHAFGKAAQVLPVDVDSYGRLVARVAVQGLDLSLGLVEAGLAWHYVRHAPEALELAAAEAKARAERRGLWVHPNPTPPWEFREAYRPRKR